MMNRLVSVAAFLMLLLMLLPAAVLADATVCAPITCTVVPPAVGASINGATIMRDTETRNNNETGGISMSTAGPGDSARLIVRNSGELSYSTTISRIVGRVTPYQPDTKC